MLSATAEHAVRALIELAVLSGSERFTGRQLSCRARIPANYLSKILGLLSHAGVIQAIRGNRGGYQLARDAAEIRLSEVAALFDRPRWRTGCFLDCRRDCQDSGQCMAHAGWKECRDVFERFLDRTTIAALVEPPQAAPIIASKWTERRAQ